jgi:hypothetical protein
VIETHVVLIVAVGLSLDGEQIILPGQTGRRKRHFG